MAVTIILPLRFVRLSRLRKLEHPEAQTIRDRCLAAWTNLPFSCWMHIRGATDSNMADEMEIGKVRYYHQHVIGIVTRKTRRDKI